MRILRGLPSFPPDLRPSVAALGAFDGIHLAHAKILDTAVERARALGVSSVACTFDPHPSAVLKPALAHAPIATLEENLARIGERGLEATLVIPFTPEFSRVEAEAFTDEVLVKTLGVREVVVGFNHTFGRGARGTAVLLRELGAARGFITHVLPPLQVNGLTVSSSAIREALGEGDVELAGALLGRPYSVTGRVQRGAGRGRTLGFPTANLKPDRPLALAAGVYAAHARWDGARADAVVNIGYRPTFEESQYWIEAYLFDFSGELYDRQLSLDFFRRIRAEMKFPGVEALKTQVQLDMAEARRLLRG
ncbi:MAG TPA: bifunctional riboflavin kinase/FAD synthetase [Methylomirabilota bacterium]|nr:bifunctional riboflavin kinase/FAD synthetase [Methylomirabilota bacterium]